MKTERVMKLILASASPRRRDLLELIGIHPLIVVPSIDESRRGGEDLETFVKRITVAKGTSINREDLHDSVILSADTVVILNDHILGKPADRRDAFDTLKALSGNKHQVWTGLSLLHGDKRLFDISRTTVYFETLTDREIEGYLDNESYKDKAGGYAIQGRASVFVRRIEGCFFNVMGLPLHLFSRMMKTMGLPVETFSHENG